MERLCKCSECEYSDATNREFTTNKPFCSNWKQYLDCGCFYGKVEGYPDARRGDIYYNPFFGDFWLVEEDGFCLIGDGYRIAKSEPIGFIKVGHVNYE